MTLHMPNLLQILFAINTLESGLIMDKLQPVAWIDKNTGKPRMEGFIQTDQDIPLYTHPVNPYQSITNTKIEPTVVNYTHPHPDNLGLAESIIKQQEIQIEALKAEVKQWEEWKESLNGWSKK